MKSYYTPRAPREIICKKCGEKFTARGPAKFCSEDCRRAANKGRLVGNSYETVEKICTICGEKFEVRKTKRAAGVGKFKYCSKECKKKFERRAKYQKICVVCGMPFISSHITAKACSPECVSALLSIPRLSPAERTRSKEKRNIKRAFADRGREQAQRDQLTDRIVKRNIYIASKGQIKYAQMTPEMIAEKRSTILALRQRKEELKAVRTAKTEQQPRYCEICGEALAGRPRKTCSEECRKEKARRDNFAMNKKRKELKVRICKECGKEFTPEYGNKRRDFHSEECLRKFNREGNHKNRDRARHFGVDYEYINVTKVFDRDGWHCQICGKSTPKKNRGTYYTNAPELDHRVPMSKGGGHLYSNTQCACRTCNGRKSNNSSYGQLPLFEIGRAA